MMQSIKIDSVITIEGVEYLAFSEHCPLDQVFEIDVTDDAIYQDFKIVA